MVCDVYVGYVKFILGDQVYPKCKLVSILGIIPWSGSLCILICMGRCIFYITMNMLVLRNCLFNVCMIKWLNKWLLC